MLLKYPLVVVTLVVSVLAACGTIREPIWMSNPTPATLSNTAVDTTLIQHGIAIYHEQRCGVCHTLEIANTAGFFGPPHDRAALTARQRIMTTTYSGQADDAETYLRESLLEPQAYIVPGFGLTQHRMPTYDFLPQSDLDALVYLLLNQG
jgi:hypothetical protein